MSITQNDLIEIITKEIQKNAQMFTSKPKLDWYTEEGYFCLGMARKLAKIAEAKALEMNCPISVAVADLSGNLVLFNRMPKAISASIHFAQNKAYTSAVYQLETGKMDKLITPESAMNALIQNDPKVTSLAGGFPITCNGRAIGGLGISGGSLAQDIAIALHTLQTMKGAINE